MCSGFAGCSSVDSAAPPGCPQTSNESANSFVLALIVRKKYLYRCILSSNSRLQERCDSSSARVSRYNAIRSFAEIFRNGCIRALSKEV